MGGSWIDRLPEIAAQKKGGRKERGEGGGGVGQREKKKEREG